jgi:hypothetical protein
MKEEEEEGNNRHWRSLVTKVNQIKDNGRGIP